MSCTLLYACKIKCSSYTEQKSCMKIACSGDVVCEFHFDIFWSLSDGLRCVKKRPKSLNSQIYEFIPTSFVCILANNYHYKCAVLEDRVHRKWKGWSGYFLMKICFSYPFPHF